MANPTISQMKINNTVYDICDYTIRNVLVIDNCYKINRTTSQQTVVANNSLTFNWNTINSLSNKIYVRYLEYDLDSSTIFPIAFSQNSMTIRNIDTTNDISFTPTASQLWYDIEV